MLCHAPVPRASHSCWRGRAAGGELDSISEVDMVSASLAKAAGGDPLGPVLGQECHTPQFLGLNPGSQPRAVGIPTLDLQVAQRGRDTCSKLPPLPGEQEPHDRHDRPHPSVQALATCMYSLHAVQRSSGIQGARHKLLLWTLCLAVKMQKKLKFPLFFFFKRL